MNEETLKELRRNIIQRCKTIIDLTEKSNLAMTPQENRLCPYNWCKF